MKVKRKNVYVREDCFHAEDMSCVVDVQAFGHTIRVTVCGKYGRMEKVFTLEQLAKQLLK